MGAVALTSASAIAAPPAGTQAASTAPDPHVVELYKAGRELLNAGKWEEGCPKFDEAMEKQPTTAILINVGDCREHAGKLAGALEAFEIAQTLNQETRDFQRRAALAAEIEQRVAKLAPRVPKLRIVIENSTPGQAVYKDHEMVPADLVGTDMHVDPGTYEVDAEAPGQSASAVRITLKEGASEQVTLRLLPHSFATQHKVSLAFGIGALAAAGAGAALAVWTTTTHGSLSDVCVAGAGKACAEAKSNTEIGALATNIAFGVAGAAAVTAVLVFTLGERPKSHQIKASVTGPQAQVSFVW